MDEALYREKQKEREARHEALCLRCGACCGLFDNDPCRHLEKKEDGTYFCGVYDNRFGNRYTVSGKLFHCVPIGDFLRGTHLYGCAYAR